VCTVPYSQLLQVQLRVVLGCGRKHILDHVGGDLYIELTTAV
jgi:hypothetical protein